MEKNICIVNFNTPELVRAAILSLWKHTPDVKVTVFDNSNNTPCFEMENVSVIDNTKGQIIDFQEFLSRFPEKQHTTNDWGSAKHCYTIQKLWDYFPEGFVLADSDVLFKKDISEFFNPNFAYIGTVYVNPKRVKKRVPRLYPFLCWINVPMCKSAGVRYFDPKRNWMLNNSTNPYDLYDTGASFLEDCKNAELPGMDVNIEHYIVHLGSASYAARQSPDEWLKTYKYLYTMEDKNKTHEDGKILVVIPYLASGAQGRELEFSVAGWRKHFKEDYLIVLVGDYHPIVETGDDIMFIECPRVRCPGHGNYWAHIDHVNKFRAVHETFPNSKGFIYTCDDIYATRDFTMKDVLVPKVRQKEISGSFHHKNKWVRDNFRTKCVLMREHLPVMNWVCHLPVYYEWDKLLAIYDKYECDKKSRVVEQLYFNIYFADSDYVMVEEPGNDYQFKMWYEYTDVKELKNALGKKMWISNSVRGWRPELEQALGEYYGL